VFAASGVDADPNQRGFQVPVVAADLWVPLYDPLNADERRRRNFCHC